MCVNGQKTVNYLKNYQVTGLMPAVFPNIKVDMQDGDRIGNVKNIKAVLAWLLKAGDPNAVRLQLNRLKYANDVSDAAAFLLKLFRFDVTKIAGLLRQRDLYKQLKDPALQQQSKEATFQDIQDFAQRARSLQTAVKVIVTQ